MNALQAELLLSGGALMVLLCTLAVVGLTCVSAWYRHSVGDL